jgi:hypothetical protein
VPAKIFIATQARGNVKIPKGYAFVDGPVGASTSPCLPPILHNSLIVSEKFPPPTQKSERGEY